MTRLMIIIGSVRPGRVGLPVGTWVHEHAQGHGGFDIDLVDLKELGLPFMDEPNHPRMRDYGHDHTKAWSARVAAADAFVLVQPEFNHSYSPALKNAIDYLFVEWQHKPVGSVSYGGVSGGSRAVAALDPVLSTVGLRKVGAAVEIAWIAKSVTDGVFTPEEFHIDALTALLDELAAQAPVLAQLRD